MFARKDRTDEFIQHLEEEISHLRTELQQLQNRFDQQAADFACERQELMNRLAGLPPQPGIATANEETQEPVTYQSRIAAMIEKQRLEMEQSYLATQGKNDKGLDEFRAEVKAEMAAIGEVAE